MGDMFRSETMALCQMFIQQEAAYITVAKLGERGCVQFRDLNSDVNAFQRKFVTEVRRCDDLERSIRYIESELIKEDINLPILNDNEWPLAANPGDVIDLEAKLETFETELRELNANSINLKNNYIEMIELQQVLEKTEYFFSGHQILNLDGSRFIDPNDMRLSQLHPGHLGFVAGVIQLDKFFAFERMLWRISHGNIFLRRSDISDMVEDPETGHFLLKTVFVAFFQGDQLKQRVKKVCAGFHASIYPCPSSQYDRDIMMRDVRLRIEDLKLVLYKTDDHRNRVLISASRHLPIWSIMIKKMKAIYHTLNMFNVDVSNKCLIGEGWVPLHDLSIVQKVLIEGSQVVESAMPSFLNVISSIDENPPTFTRTNRFTKGFQSLIDAYGIASYREANPALYTCITFPFLFAVMFGDVGHGLILLAFSLFMVLKENDLKKNKGEIFNIFFGGRYIILLMGLFSLYTGFMYNDIFSKSMNVFGSAWFVKHNESVILNNNVLQLDPAYNVKGVYPMGLDPVWQLAENKIIFLNSYKMKLSIIFGVLHMIFGVSMSLVNFIYFRKTVNIIMDFMPQMIFLCLLFGYMVFMMFFKWIKYSANDDILANTPGCAPSILILFINMMLFGHQAPLDGCDEFMFENQELIQTIFVLIAVTCIPWMLLGKPLFYICTRHKKQTVCENNMDDNHKQNHDDKHDESARSIGEIFIQQAIHTIEYVLSTISHTASYLRLWALSLAHAQLSEVLWGMVFAMSFSIQNYFGSIFLFVIFAFWAILTVGILVLIEGLSAFLHTLRLHWVEFMSKFYVGCGYAFQPFSFQIILDNNEER